MKVTTHASSLVRLPVYEKGFTLIELLVVITIIVVLLALLTPALDRAIFEAEMAVCMAQHGGIAKGATAYAFAHKRYFPYRPSVHDADGQINRLRSATLAGEPIQTKDDRPILESWIPIDAFQDPLNEEIDLKNQDSGAGIYPSTWPWFSVSLIDLDGVQYSGMNKVGDRLGWKWASEVGGPSAGPVRTWKFDYLTSESDWIRLNDEVRASHPDDDGILEAIAIRGEALFITVRGYMSRWFSYSPPPKWRGKVDQNLSRTDGSVSRIDDIEAHDERTVEVPEFMKQGGSFPDNAGHLPIK